MSFIWTKATFTPSQISSMTEVECVKEILTGCANAIIGTNTGWSIDTTNHASQNLLTNTPVSVNTGSGASTNPIYAYYFQNSISHDKMMLLYNYGSSSSSTTNPLVANTDVQFQITKLSNTGDNLYSTYGQPGLSVSLISGKYSTENFGEDCSQNSFLSTHATRLTGFNNYNSYANLATERSSSSWGSYASFYFGCKSTGDCIISVYRPASLEGNALLPTRICGKIFSQLCNSTDTDSYGAIRLWNATSSSATNSYSTTFGTDSQPFQNTSMPTSLNTFSYGDVETKLYVSSLVHGTSGDVYLSGSGKLYDIDASAQKKFQQVFVTFSRGENSALTDYTVLQSIVTAGSPVKAIKLPNPYVVYTYESPWLVNNYGVVSGNGLKGVLDQDVISFIPNSSSKPYVTGTIIDDGYTLVSACYGVCYGWDPSNTDDVNPFKVPAF